MKFAQPCEGHVSRLSHGRSVNLEQRQSFNIDMIIVTILEYVSKGEDVHDSWHLIQSHWKLVNLDETDLDGIVV